MIKQLFLISLTAFASWTASAQTSIPIANAGFEDDALGCQAGGNCYNYLAPGWLPDWAPSGLAGTYKPSGIQFPRGIPQGIKVGWINSNGFFFATVPATLQPNKTYTLRLYVGQRADAALLGYRASLLAGGVTLASDDSLRPAPGTFLEDVIIYRSGVSSPLIGQTLQISIRGGSGNAQVNIDNVSLAVE